jgi:hypothetical protein
LLHRVGFDVAEQRLYLGRVDGLDRVCGEWIPKPVDL